MEQWWRSAFLAMCHQETKTEKQAFVHKQTQQAASHGFIRCFCEIKVPVWKAYRCLYCGEFYCLRCAEVHFGKTRAEYQAEKETNQNDGSDDK